ncbi:MAG TPA: hypothetical protein VJY42_02325 [Candidatus Methanomethylophilaceae archaeon]|nr:hypothetical protein [Candidatus Methanomethylophilaceae archaeon]
MSDCRPIEKKRLHELLDLADSCADTMGCLTIDEAAIVLGMINFIGIDGDKKLYRSISKDVTRLYPVLEKLLEVGA